MLHEDSNFVPIIVHEEVVRLHDEHDKCLLFATRSFHSTFDYFFGRNRPGIVLSNFRLTVSEDLLPLSVQESPNLFAFRVVSEFRDLARDLRHGKQRVSPFYHDSLTTTTHRTTRLLLQSDRLVFGTH